MDEKDKFKKDELLEELGKVNLDKDDVQLTFARRYGNDYQSWSSDMGTLEQSKIYDQIMSIVNLGQGNSAKIYAHQKPYDVFKEPDQDFVDTKSIDSFANVQYMLPRIVEQADSINQDFSLNKVKFYIVTIYLTNYPVHFICKFKSSMYFRPSTGFRLTGDKIVSEKDDDQRININCLFDAIVYDNSIMIVNRANLESFFDMNKYTQKLFDKSMNLVKSSNLIANYDKLNDYDFKEDKISKKIVARLSDLKTKYKGQSMTRIEAMSLYKEKNVESYKNKMNILATDINKDIVLNKNGEILMEINKENLATIFSIVVDKFSKTYFLEEIENNIRN